MSAAIASLSSLKRLQKSCHGERAAISQDQTPDQKFCLYWNPFGLHGLPRHRINPLGLLFISAVFGAVGLYWLGTVTGVAMAFIAATVFALGKTLYWPRMLGVIGEREPRWAVALKFAPELAVTRLKSIEINVGRTGSLNPSALLEPVQVGGVTVKMATLHNFEDIARKDLRAGDWVVVKRAGEVIPQVVEPVRERRTGEERPFAPPERCPAVTADDLRASATEAVDFLLGKYGPL